MFFIRCGHENAPLYSYSSADDMMAKLSSQNGKSSSVTRSRSFTIGVRDTFIRDQVEIYKKNDLYGNAQKNAAYYKELRDTLTIIIDINETPKQTIRDADAWINEIFITYDIKWK